jgi:hypothetical protein
MLHQGRTSLVAELTSLRDGVRESGLRTRLLVFNSKSSMSLFCTQEASDALTKFQHRLKVICTSFENYSSFVL